jgi:hypothetical protein
VAVNQYVKEGNGPNAHKKGNRSNSKRDSSEIVAMAKKYGDDIDKYKRYAEARRKKVTYSQERTGEVYYNIAQYVMSRLDEDRPFTISGLQLAVGCSYDTYQRMASGECDYLLEQFIDVNNIDIETVDTYIHGMPAVAKDLTSIPSEDDLKGAVLLIPYSQIIEKAHLMVREQAEERLYMKARVGDIFALKAQHGWREDETPHTVNQTLVIASEEQARKAIELLK